MTARVRQYTAEAAQRYGLTADDVLGQSRATVPCAARTEVMRRLRCDGFSYQQIGRWTGRHYTTVRHAVLKAISE